MSRRSPNLKSGRPRGIICFRRRLVLPAIAVVLGMGVVYLAIEKFHDPGQKDRDASTSSLVLALVPEAQDAGTDDPNAAERQARPAAPGQTDGDLLSERDQASDVATEISDSKGEEPAAAKTNEETPANNDNDEAEDPPELSISGAVLDDRGSLLPGVRVEARKVGPPGQSRRQSGLPGGTLSQVTDNLGSFVFEPLPDGEYQLSVEDTEEFYGTDLRVRAGVANAELRVQRIREVRVYGHIIDVDGRALENVRVRSLDGSRAPPSDIDGAYEIIVDPVKAGQAPVLEFQHPNYRSQRQRVEEIVGSDADAVRLDVEMESTGKEVAVLGYVFGPRGEPVPDAEVWLSSAEPRNYLTTRSNGGGEFEFERVEVGDAYKLGVNPGPDYRQYVSDSFAVGPGNTAHDVRLEGAGDGSLSGRLVDPEGRALKHFSVWLRSQNSGGDHAPIPVTSDAGGNFEVNQVPAGTLRLESTSQPRLQAGGIELRPGETRHVEVPLDWGERWMFGRVVDADGSPVAGAEVTLQWSRQPYDVASSSHRRTATDLEGFFTFSNLGARDYNVTVQVPGFQTLRRNYAPGNDDLVIVLQATAGGGQ